MSNPNINGIKDVLIDMLNKNMIEGSGCGSVGRAVASDTWFKSSHRQKLIYIEHLFTVNCVFKRQK